MATIPDENCFHYKDGIFFARNADAAVEVWRGKNFGGPGELLFTVDEPSWASIVCSVSAGGETGERWMEARRFHGLKE